MNISQYRYFDQSTFPLSPFITYSTPQLDTRTDSPFKDGFELCVLPGHVMLAKLNDDIPLTVCSSILVRTFYSIEYLRFYALISIYFQCMIWNAEHY